MVRTAHDMRHSSSFASNLVSCARTSLQAANELHITAAPLINQIAKAPVA
jgi:hypothetical protein